MVSFCEELKIVFVYEKKNIRIVRYAKLKPLHRLRLVLRIYHYYKADPYCHVACNVSKSPYMRTSRKRMYQ